MAGSVGAGFVGPGARAAGPLDGPGDASLGWAGAIGEIGRVGCTVSPGCAALSSGVSPAARDGGGAWLGLGSGLSTTISRPAVVSTGAGRAGSLVDARCSAAVDGHSGEYSSKESDSSE